MQNNDADWPIGRLNANISSPPGASGDLWVVGIGASAGGLDACKKLVESLPADNGLAFILVQHLDPTHESMMVDLLAGHTQMTVLQAAEGMPVKRNHLYAIPPGTYLSVAQGALHVSLPQAPHGARLPFDFLLNSLADQYGSRAICVILSGTGADGSLGLEAIKENGGLVIAQDPKEAGYDGMPRSAIMTGLTDLVLPVAKIAEVLLEFDGRRPPSETHGESGLRSTARPLLKEIIELLRTRTAHDFRLYKPGTLERRIERRMAMTGIGPDDDERYLELLRNSSADLDLLGSDLLINVTSFFRDPKVFDLLAAKIVPDLLGGHTADLPLRIWVAGCSTGEETYSLAMIFLEQIAATNSNVKLKVFASDVDPDAVAKAREGFYPDTIEADVSEERLARFFSREDQGYRILPELRAVVVFAVQDVLADPPFSRLDLVSCRNLLIYLRPGAQEKVISLFHFALRDGGILLLGNSETVGNAEGLFEEIAKPERLYRHVGRRRLGEFDFLRETGEGIRLLTREGQSRAPSRQTALAELCRQLVIDSYAPAVVLINHQNECLYSLGPTDRYLRVAPGQPTHDLFSMARESVRIRLRSAIEQAKQENTLVVVAGGLALRDENPFRITVQPVLNDGEELLLICFANEPKPEPKRALSEGQEDASRVSELERELEATRTELQGAIRNLEISSQEQKAINEEALSINEEFQSTNEELLTSKEELQSLNEELTALNSQLQETLERQRTTSNDLQNILYSTNVATLFLDTSLRIRFFTPATKSLFNVIPSDIGRPLADLNSLATDEALLAEARTVLRTETPLEQEIEAQSGAWYIRRILPYRTRDNGVEGVVITFIDVSEQRRVAEALENAKKDAQQANVAKSRFLAAAGHDLRQPLQTLALLQGVLASSIESERGKKIMVRMEETLSTISGMLNTLLDIDQIEAGTVRARMVDFPINDLLDRLKSQFIFHTQAKNLTFRVVPCCLTVRSDPILLEQVVRNLLSNALKYTSSGKVLLGCRRRAGCVSVEVWDTGAGIPEDELDAIFEEYHQLDNEARERSRGLGLGLFIVKRLSELLGQSITVRSHLGKGSMFAIDVALPLSEAVLLPEQPQPQDVDEKYSDGIGRVGEILVVEDDPEVREFLALLLGEEGHHASSVCDGPAAMELVARRSVRPDLILTDYHLPNGMNGIEVILNLRKKLNRQIPGIILTGDMSSNALQETRVNDCVRLNKPVKLADLTRVIRGLLPNARMAVQPPTSHLDKQSVGPPVIFIIDDDVCVRESLREVIEDRGWLVESYATCEDFLEAYQPGREACLLLDAYLPEMSGLELLRRLKSEGYHLPVIMITGHSDVRIAVQAMQADAADFIEKPVGRDELYASIELALDHFRDSSKLHAWRETAIGLVAKLTERQHQIMELVLAGQPSKNIAADLGISQRTVESHRASIMKKTGSKSLPALARLALAAASSDAKGNSSKES